MLASFTTWLQFISKLDTLGTHLMRLAIAVVFLWIGALKFAPYEADSITPFVANSPFMSFFYEHPEDYKAHLTHEGELNGKSAFGRPQITHTSFPTAWA